MHSLSQDCISNVNKIASFYSVWFFVTQHNPTCTTLLKMFQWLFINLHKNKNSYSSSSKSPLPGPCSRVPWWKPLESELLPGQSVVLQRGGETVASRAGWCGSGEDRSVIKESHRDSTHEKHGLVHWVVRRSKFEVILESTSRCFEKVDPVYWVWAFLYKINVFEWREWFVQWWGLIREQ